MFLNGVVKVDKDVSNTSNTGDINLAGITVVAKNATTNVVEDTTITDVDGKYTFFGLEKSQKINLEFLNPNTDKYRFSPKMTNGSNAVPAANQLSAKASNLTPSTDINQLTLLQEAITITYNGQGGSVIKVSESTFPGDTLTLPLGGTKTGYTFKGLYNAATGGTKYNATLVAPNASTTIYSQWNINAYTLTYNVEGTLSTSQVNFDANLTTPATPTKAGYLFIGWYTSSTNGTKIDITTMKMPANDYTLYAQFTAQNQTITFNTNGGSTAPANIVQATATSVNLGLVTSPSKAGYTFSGWFVGSTQYSGTINMPAGGLTLLAKWTATNQTITFNTNGGSTAPANIVQATATSVNLGLVTSPSKAGYAFNGWFVGSTQYSGTINMPAGGLTLLAKWTATNQTITFNTNGGSNAPANIVQATATSVNLGLVTPPSKAGYAFNGWFVGTTQYSGTINMPAGGLTLLASWSATNQTITFNTNGGSTAPANIVQATATSVNLGLVTPPSKAGYAFNGWFVGTTQYSGTINMPAGGLTLLANWSATNQTITFNTNGGSTAPANIVQKTDTSVNLADVTSPTKAGYTFSGWFVGSTQYSGTINMPAGGLTLLASWSATNQTITFNTNGGSTAPANIVQKTDTSVNLADVTSPTKAGYAFNGWFVGSTQYSGTINMPAGGLTLLASWSATNQTITFNLNGGTSTKPADIVLLTGATVDLTLISSPVKKGYTFSGWFVGATKYSGTFNMPANGLNLIATWEAQDQTITFDPKGGSPKPADIIQKTATNVDLSTIVVPIKKGYQLKGWYNNDVKFNDSFAMPNQSITLTAIWTPVLSSDGPNEKFKASNMVIKAVDVKKINVALVKSKAKPSIYLVGENNVKVQDIAIKSIDKTKVQAKQGSYPLYIISVSNQKHLIYVSVGRTKEPRTNSVNALDSSNFKMSLKDYNKFVKNKTIQKEVIKRSYTKVWNIKTNKATGKISVKMTKPNKAGKFKVSIKASGLSVKSLQDISASSDELTNDITMDITGTASIQTDGGLPGTGINNNITSISIIITSLLVALRLRKRKEI